MKTSFIKTNALRTAAGFLGLTALAAYAIAAGSPVVAGLSDGTFTGKGMWKSAESQGSYTVSTSINKNTVTSSYTLPDGSKKEWVFTMNPGANGLFEVTSQGIAIGSGYCIEHVELCHYEINVGKMVLEETLTHEGDKLYKFGSKDEGSGRVVWQEALDAQ